MKHKPKDLPRAELQKLADETLQQYPGSQVFFKFTCAHCGERCQFREPNALYERGECHVCGKETEVKQGGFMLHFLI
jgi:hypothetical protein